MAFDSLSEKLSKIFKNLRGKGRLSESDIKEAMREVKLALLEADVNFKVVKEFIASVTQRAIGQDVLDGLNPAQMVIKIVNEELTALMGSGTAKLILSANPSIIMFVGLQGSGKTTNIAKLSGYLKKNNAKRPLLVACDVYRPAAIQQLNIVGSQLGIPVFEQGQGNPVEIAKAAIDHAKRHGNDLVLIDTAGRLHIDEQLMDELKNIKSAVKPHEIVLVLDAMTGQDAVTTAQAFDEALGVDSFILTKLDGDTRGGAALSIKAITGKPIKFVGMGEKLDAIEQFHPERMASRILGMGDVLTLIERAQQSFDEKKAAELEKKLQSNKFTIQDYYDNLVQLKSMGSMSEMLAMIPGLDKKALSGASIDEKMLAHTEAIILSMTPYERENPKVLNFSRKKRIARGSGCTVEAINKLLKQFEMMQQLTRQMANGKMPKGFGKFPGMPF